MEMKPFNMILIQRKNLEPINGIKTSQKPLPNFLANTVRKMSNLQPKFIQTIFYGFHTEDVPLAVHHAFNAFLSFFQSFLRLLPPWSTSVYPSFATFFWHLNGTFVQTTFYLCIGVGAFWMVVYKFLLSQNAFKLDI